MSVQPVSRPTSPSSRVKSWLFLSLAIALSLAIFALQVGSPLCFAPLVAFAALQVFPKLGERADQQIFLGFLTLCFFVDDISQVAWGREVDTWTEQMGILLFQSFGLTGIEYFALGMSVFVWVTRRPDQHQRWFRLGLGRLLGVGIAIFAASFFAGLYGMLTGSTPNTFFVQIRFLHNLVLWTFLGFVLIRDIDFALRVLYLITALVIAKSLQAIYVYFDNLAVFREAEYLIDHYFSAFSVMAMVVLGYTALRARSILWWPPIALALGSILVAYILNDRRTSYVGVGLAGMLVPFLMPHGWIRQRLPMVVGLGVLAVLYIGGTWNLPAPIGFIGATVRSFGQETGTEGPSYRDLENANLMFAISENPTMGLGYGREFEEKYKMPDISFVYPRYRMVPHNLFLAGWAYGGPITIAATSLVFVCMIWLAGRLMRGGYSPDVWFFGLVSLFYALQYFSYTFGDIGLQINRNQMMAGVLLGGCYRLLVEHQVARGDDAN